ncbi:hypothetical protein VST7929_03165 [Vibrio stylophorae]|uniref:Uncharacterized protein n=1 Tax=Vibrio stylophorae TaxID=659351 RepID=A0ABN8DW27_9VIBR|nr:hypothetical protein [Vibrio stylophorae]CAH0535660.1 hypothetical protein VST7929_03165 [Vibrio stylophorae]
MDKDQLEKHRKATDTEFGFTWIPSLMLAVLGDGEYHRMLRASGYTVQELQVHQQERLGLFDQGVAIADLPTFVINKNMIG